MNATESPQTLGEWMEDRVGELGLTWDEVAKEAGVSYETLRAIRNGTRTVFRPKTKHGIQRALHWSKRSIDLIRAGKAPIPLDDEPPPSQLEQELRQIRAAVDKGTIDAELGARLEEKVCRDYTPSTTPPTEEGTDSRFGRRSG